MQHDEELGRLVELIGALRNNRSHSGYQAVVLQDPVTARGIYRKYQVTAKPFEGLYELKHADRAGDSGMTYRPNQKLLVVAEAGKDPLRVDGQDSFPTTLPVLAMFSPLELPIWGGDRDGKRVTSTSSEGEGFIRLNLGSKESPGELHAMGYAIIDVFKGIATELFYDNHRFTVEDIREIPPATPE